MNDPLVKFRRSEEGLLPSEMDGARKEREGGYKKPTNVNVINE